MTALWHHMTIICLAAVTSCDHYMIGCLVSCDHNMISCDVVFIYIIPSGNHPPCRLAQLVEKTSKVVSQVVLPPCDTSADSGCICTLYNHIYCLFVEADNLLHFNYTHICDAANDSHSKQWLPMGRLI